MPNLFNKAIKARSMPNLLAEWIDECSVPVHQMFFTGLHATWRQLKLRWITYSSFWRFNKRLELNLFFKMGLGIQITELLNIDLKLLVFYS